MPEAIKLIVTAPPDAFRAASACGLPLGHMAYRVGPGAHLLRANIPLNMRGGLMVIDNSGFDGQGEPGTFCQQVLRECNGRGYQGVILDFEGHPHPFLGQITKQLGALLPHRGWTLYVTEAYADFSDRAKVILPSALSGGSFTQRLAEAAERYGAQRLALGIQRSAEDFTLPSPSGSGTPLSREELAQRLNSRGAAIFFSDDLCAHYFTYMSRQSGAHFVLFDNAGSIRKKIKIAQNLGFFACLLAWPEVDDILADILH